ncbi:MAG: CHASE2 domain-containing protein [Chitinispirillaceae bacterium]|nr:CHASE2 domain-containing protein [Chitinispirillaceae bacterium]
MNRKKAVILSIGTIALAVAAFLRPFRFIDNLWYDLHFIFAAADASGPVVVVGIDPKSIEHYGALPWNRGTMAALVEHVAAARPAAIALDFLFPRRGDASENDSLAAVFSRTSWLVLPFRADGITTAPQEVRQPMTADLFKFRFSRIVNKEFLDDIMFYSAKTVSAADTLFSPFARCGGFLNVSTSTTSQKIREAIQVIRVGDEYFPSFGIAAVAAYCRLPPAELELDGRGSVAVGGHTVPLTSYAASTAINFRSERAQVRAVSAAELLDGTVDPEIFAGKLVFVGVTDPSSGADFFATPVTSQFPGVMVWATMATDILEQRILHDPQWPFLLLGVVIIFFLFPGCALIFPARKRRATLILGGALVIVSFIVSITLFRTAHTIWNFPSIVYAWFFSLLWLAALRADPMLAGPIALKLDLQNPPDDAFPAPPTPAELAETLPQTDTTGFITKLLTSHDEKEEPGSEPATLSGTIVEVKREELSAQPRPKPMVADLVSMPRDLAGGTIVRLLGTGGMADVYLVWHPRLEAYRAVKVMKPGCSENFLSRFETEIRIIAKLDHPNIVHCYNAGQWHSLPYLEMEYVHGASMEEIIKNWNNITVEQALFVGIQVCRALYYAHNQIMTIYGKTYRGIVHRDLKPANIMLSRSGQIKLTDFGIARPGTVSLHTVDTGSVVGTLPYLAPEQLDQHELTASADIYALGTTLYELIAGERAFPQVEIPALLRAKSIGAYKPLARAAQVAPEIAGIIDTAMAVDAAKRFADAQAFGEALERALFNICGYDATAPVAALVRRVWET